MDDARRIVMTGFAAPIEGDEIDTDRIVPARFLKEITFERMGEFLFYDVRFNADSSETDFILNRSPFNQATFLITGKNFGCGSSREHAPQAIMRFGIKAIIGESFAEIFAGNCRALGIPTVEVTPDIRNRLAHLVLEHPDDPVTLSLETQTVGVSGQSFSVSIAGDKRTAFLTGEWDSTGPLKQNIDKVLRTAEQLPYVSNFK
jgi:3-isopropylmalate/(R)-2-methylmalate dehydratase small subunit